MIPFIDLKRHQERLLPQLGAAIARVLKHGQYILGPEVAELEKRLADFCGARFALTCASGTDALLLALMAKGIGAGDAVFVPSFTFVATAEVVVLLNATPVFVDVDADTFLMDVQSLKAAVRRQSPKECSGDELSTASTRLPAADQGSDSRKGRLTSMARCGPAPCRASGGRSSRRSARLPS